MKFVLPIIAVLALVFAFQNCGKMASVRPDAGSVNSSSTGGGGVGSTSGQHIANCLVNGDTNACVFWKNPLASAQTFAVEIRGTTTPGILQNASVRVTSASQPAAQAPWKYDLVTDSTQAVGQVMSYYWSQRLIEYAQSVGGTLAVSGRAVNIQTEAPVTGWSSQANTIYLGRNSVTNASLDASVLLHLISDANVFWAVGATIYPAANDTNHVDCGVTNGPIYQKECCASANGCMRAISAGLGDHLQAMIFSSAPAFGDHYSNNPEGISVCGVPRDPTKNTNLTFAAAYDSCQAQGLRGATYAMGAAYAGAWWSIRNAPGAVVAEVDKLYFDHIARLRGTDTFREALNAIIASDLQLYNGKYASAFQAEFAKRGIN